MEKIDLWGPLTSDDLSSLSGLKDKSWRLNNLYKIVDKNGDEVIFHTNAVQNAILDGWHNQMIILKARQLGVSTFFAISFLDDCLFNANISAGIIADKRESAEDLFRKKIKFAYDRLPEFVYLFGTAKNDRVGELSFTNGSSFRVSTGFRGGTYQRLLISEFGKICANDPETAREIVVGSLNTVAKDQVAVIESTANGRRGYFYDFVKTAQRINRPLTSMDMKLFFFPWYSTLEYSIPTLQEPTMKQNQYFESLNIPLTDEQKSWYLAKQAILGDDMTSEFPSTPDEAFAAVNTGLYYGAQIEILRKKGRICSVPYQEYSLVHTAWDLGLDDFTAIWFFQVSPGGEIQFIDFVEGSEEYPKYYCDILANKGYNYGTHFLPHDAKNREKTTGNSYEDFIRPLIKGDIQVLPIDDVFNGIQAVRAALGHCVFDSIRCTQGLHHLENYHKQWDDKLSCYKNTPVKDVHCHASDAMRYAIVGINNYLGGGSIENDYKALRRFWGG